MLSGDDMARMAYLILLGVAIGGWMIAEARGNLGRTARQAAIWGFIFVGLIAVFGLWGDVRDQVIPRQTVVSEGVIEVPQGFDGHYRLTLQVNGTPVDFIVDTGASQVVLTRQDAERVGIDVASLSFDGRAGTANGTVRTADVRVNEIRLGEIRDQNFTVSVNAGEMDTSLLGMSYLRRFDKLEISGNRLVLTR